MQGREATRIGKMVSLGRLVDLYGEKALPAIALAERLDMLRLQPCLKKFLVSKPFWISNMRPPPTAPGMDMRNVIGMMKTQYDPADVDMALYVTFENMKPRRPAAVAQ
jgi:hypothetical protein